MRRTSAATALLFAAAFALIFACSRSSSDTETGAPPAAVDPGVGGTILSVESHVGYDVNVYLLGGGGQRTRIGMVPSGRTQLFPLTSSMTAGTGQVRFVAEPSGAAGQNISSDATTVQPGDTVHFPIWPE